ncbi:molybdenum cofactor guanylyltransferase [Parasphingopyxis lamellibrachiae]|uniref:Molybdenum cofactor guanylyltransferase n=1 Tax=Parasphingopyxis lamellibrachiae TaxID=680125 RepID=A0A3D9F958_9SPHN|nr:molybdenum cofactor guanylyltransferase [Parasphingopyxis lamellibrachiae]RED13363.1 molybdenum cofactor guanylyltransferase [Parasphingopyxis lamellibrachiae]
MRRLGVILAGGQSKRFGSDKAEALLNGKPLIEHVRGHLAIQCDAIVICGREYTGTKSIADRPSPGEGPLGGLNAALSHASKNGFDEVLSVACDNADLPEDIAEQLSPPPAYVALQPVIGLWPATMSGQLNQWMRIQDKRAMMAWIEESGARPVQLSRKTANINNPEDLTALENPNGI